MITIFVPGAFTTKTVEKNIKAMYNYDRVFPYNPKKYKTLKKIHSNAVERLKDLLSSHKGKVVLIGYSHGGMIIHDALQNSRRRNIFVINIGCPKLISSRRGINIFNKNDIALNYVNKRKETVILFQRNTIYSPDPYFGTHKKLKIQCQEKSLMGAHRLPCYLH